MSPCSISNPLNGLTAVETSSMGRWEVTEQLCNDLVILSMLLPRILESERTVDTCEIGGS